MTVANMKIRKFVRIYYNKVIESIAFYPALIAIGFLLLSFLMITFDFSEAGKEFKSGLSWLSLKDASTARSIISTVAAAIISLTVFSFSMVMIVLNQAASQMSNRVLNSMIENRFQQMILGFYIGTIVYALFLLSTIRDIESGILVPALSIYVLILMTVIDIFLFIYFLDYVTQTVKYETVIDRVCHQTKKMMVKEFRGLNENFATWEGHPYTEIVVKNSGYFQNFNRTALLQLSKDKNFFISFQRNFGSYLLKGTVVLRVYCAARLDKEIEESIANSIEFFPGQPIDVNADYGFGQLTEIALRALSPGINDPGTAVISLHALSGLLQYRMYCKMPSLLNDDENTPRIYIGSSTFLDMFEKCIVPIWRYGKEDQYVQKAMLEMILQLKECDTQVMYTALYNDWIGIITKQMKNSEIF